MAAEPFTRSQTVAALALAVVAGCVPALQPILLGGLLAEHRLTAGQIGEAATVEAIGMAMAAAIAGAFLRPIRLRMIAVAGVAALCAANGLTMIAGGAGILAARGLNGAASGVLLWILVGMMTRAANPGRLFALYVLSQAIGAFVLATLFSSLVIPRFGAAGGYAVLVALGAALLLPIALLKPAYAPIASGGGARRPTGRGGVGLLAVALDMAGVFAFWVYLAPLGRQLGFSTETIGIAISAGIGVQILGGLASFALAGRLGGAAATAASAGISALVVLLLLAHPALWVFYLASGSVAFLWMFAPPFHLPLLLAADPSRRSAMFVSSAQLAGIAGGPMIASLVVTDSAFIGSAVASIALFAAAALVALAAISRRVSNTGDAAFAA